MHIAGVAPPSSRGGKSFKECGVQSQPGIGQAHFIPGSHHAILGI